MSLHPEARALMARLATWQRENAVPPRAEQTVAQQRHYGRLTGELRAADGLPAVAESRELTLPTRSGPRRARLIRPLVQEGLPTLVYVHGGGYVVGSIDETELEARRFALATGSNVVQVSYRLAPEDPWPAGVDDLVDALAAIRDGAVEGIDGARVTLAGVSAGAGLAAAATRRLVLQVDHSIGQLVLLSPWLDMTMTSPSGEIFASGYQLERQSLLAFCRDYIPEGTDPGHPELSAARHPVPQGWPRTILFAAGCDPLVDDAALFARRLDEAGVRHVIRVVPGMLHGFHGWFQRLPSLVPDLAWLDEEIRDGH